MKKLLSIIISVCLIFSFCNIAVIAAKKENLCETFQSEFYQFPKNTGKYILNEEFFWVREDEINVKENENFPADVIVDFISNRIISETQFSTYYDEKDNIFTIPCEEVEKFAKKFFNQIDSKVMRAVTYIDNSGNEVLEPTFFADNNYIFKGYRNAGGGKAWIVKGYTELSNDKYNVYLNYSLPEEESNIYSKSVVTYIDSQLKFLSFEQISSIPQNIITPDTVFEEDDTSSEESVSSDDSTVSEEDTQSKNQSAVSSKDGSTSDKNNSSEKEDVKDSSSKKPQNNTSSKINSSITSSNKTTSSKKPQTSASSKNNSSLLDDKTNNTSSDIFSSDNTESNGISVSLGSEGNDSSDSDTAPDIIKTFAQTKTVKIEAKTSVFPENTVIEIAEITEGEKFDSLKQALNEKAAKFVAYDIGAKNNNVFIQPNGTVNVTFNIPDGFDLSLLEVWFIADNGSIEVIPSVVDGLAKTVTAELSHFSSYAVVENAIVEEITFSDKENGQKSTEEGKNSSKTVWIIVAVIVCFLIAGAAMWYFLIFKKKSA